MFLSVVSYLLHHLLLTLDATLSHRPDLLRGSWGGEFQKQWKKMKQLFPFIFSSPLYHFTLFLIDFVGIRDSNQESIEMPSLSFLPSPFLLTSFPAEIPTTHTLTLQVHIEVCMYVQDGDDQDSKRKVEKLQLDVVSNENSRLRKKIRRVNHWPKMIHSPEDSF